MKIILCSRAAIPTAFRSLHSRWLRALLGTAGFLTLVAFAPAQPCPAPKTWFPHSQTPAPDPSAFPANATDCDFHQWAWQTFLYLTQMENGQLRFLNYPNDTDLFPSNPTQKPLALTALAARNVRPPLVLKVRTGKPREGGAAENPNSIFQAGSGGVLVGQDGNPLYYSVHFSPTFYGFVQANGYYDYSTYIKASPDIVFPIGSIELKASWRIVAGQPNPREYTIAAQVPTLAQDSSGNITAGPPLRNVTVALVGLHVVGVVANHPEFVWATFEQISNAPNLPPGIQPDSNQPVSPANFTFYKAGTAAASCNQQPSTYTLNATAQTLSPVTQVFRQFADGGGIKDNVVAIQTLNLSVRAQLGRDTAANYRLVGGVWLLPGALHPDMSPAGTDLHGSPDLANATMETFVQQPFKNPTPPPAYFTSCFGCHTTTASQTAGGLPIPAMNMNLSHILTDGLVTQEVARRRLLKK